MFNFFLLLLLKERRSLFVNKLSVITRLVAIITNFLFYFYTAKAFKPAPDFFSHTSGGWDLFEFVIIGEFVLFFALDALVVFSTHIRDILSNEVLDPILNTRTPIYKTLFYLSSTTLCYNLVTFLIQIFIFGLFFPYEYKVLSLMKCVLLNFSFLPLFLGLGLLASAIIFITRRGGAGFGIIVSVLGILSGAYFPITVFPSFIQSLSKILNPLHFLLSQSRLILKDQELDYNYFLILISSTLTGILLIALSSWVFKTVINIHKKRGEPLILSYR